MADMEGVDAGFSMEMNVGWEMYTWKHIHLHNVGPPSYKLVYKPI